MFQVAEIYKNTIFQKTNFVKYHFTRSKLKAFTAVNDSVYRNLFYEYL